MDKKITLELTEDDAFLLQQFCADAASVWYDKWRRAKNGKVSRLDTITSCQRMNNRAWNFANQIQELRSAQ